MTKTLTYVIICSIQILFCMDSLQAQMLVDFDFNQPTLPEAAFEYEGDAGNLEFRFWDSSSTNITSWFWDFGDGNSDIVQNPTHTYASAGVYDVCLIVGDSINCQDSTCTEINTASVSISERGNDEHLSVYPNPFSQNLIISWNSNSTQRVNIELVNAFGKHIKVLYSGDTEAGQQQLALGNSLQDLPEGIYFLQMQTGDHVSVEKIIKK